MESDKINPVDLEDAKRSLAIWMKSYNIEKQDLTEGLKKATGGSKKKKNKSRKKR
jgi:hypothetical protein